MNQSTVYWITWGLGCDPGTRVKTLNVMVCTGNPGMEKGREEESERERDWFLELNVISPSLILMVESNLHIHKHTQDIHLPTPTRANGCLNASCHHSSFSNNKQNTKKPNSLGAPFYTSHLGVTFLPTFWKETYLCVISMSWVSFLVFKSVVTGVEKGMGGPLDTRKGT